MRNPTCLENNVASAINELTRRIDARTFLSVGRADSRKNREGKSSGEREWLGSRGGRAEKKLTVIGVKAFLTRLA